MKKGLILWAAVVSAVSLGGFATAAHAQFQTPQAVVTTLYGYYGVGAGASNQGFPNDDSRTVRRFMDRSMSLLWEGSSARLSYDFFIQGQDWKLSAFKATKGQLQGQINRVVVTFKNLNETVRLTFVVIKNSDGWRIYDVESEKRGTLRAALKQSG